MFDFLEEILREFKDVPGLGFLRNLHTKVMVNQIRFRRKTERLRVLHNDLQGTKRQFKGLGSKSKAAKRRSD